MSIRIRIPFLIFVGSVFGCAPTPVVPTNPTWADVAPILRGACASCHGSTAKTTGGGYRLDLFDATLAACGDASLALDPAVILAGSPVAAALIKSDVVPQEGARWARMPPQPSPALADWQRDTILRWSAQPAKGPPSAENRPPNISVSQFPSAADKQLTFTAIIDDPDGDAVIGAINVGGVSFLMNHAGSFAVSLNASAWPAGPLSVIATVCDGWSSGSYELGPVQVRHD